ncbi:phage major tail protein, TP901-1 family [Rummeliibacillus sp. NPDC094406]|uniref:phage major tail protein, TP901-1 family n=1 Tax=Rummeliibacillus sp. NPDC094406 TaxID=3364511 RepID=UPI0038095081
MTLKNGKDTILLIQKATAALGESAFVIAQQTDLSHSIESEMSDEKTKFGRIVAPGTVSESFELTAYGDSDDKGQELIMEALKNGEQIKAWKVDLVLNSKGKHNATFAYGYFESADEKSGTEGFVEISGTIQVLGQSQKGELDPLPIEVIEFGKYGFEKPGEKSGELGGTQTEQPAG